MRKLYTLPLVVMGMNRINDQLCDQLCDQLFILLDNHGLLSFNLNNIVQPPGDNASMVALFHETLPRLG